MYELCPSHKTFFISTMHVTLYKIIHLRIYVNGSMKFVKIRAVERSQSVPNGVVKNQPTFYF